MEEPDRMLVWVPSVRAARHLLNEQLASKPGEREGVYPPTMVTPAGFLKSLIADLPGMASEIQCLQAWKEVLIGIRPEGLRDLFPIVPEHQRIQWAYSIARQLLNLRTRLAMEDMDLEGVSKKVYSTERERWQVLRRLEDDYRGWLSESGLADPNDYLRIRLEEQLGELPYERILVAGVLNLSPLEVRCLEYLSSTGLPVELVLPVPAERKNQLDAWGRPLADVWNTMPLPEDLLEGSIHRSPEPRELVRNILELAKEYEDNVDAMVVGSPDDELADYLVERSLLSPAPFYSPVGQSLNMTGFGRLILLMEQFRKGGNLAVLREMLHNSLFRAWVERSGMDPRALEIDLLSVHQEHYLFNYASLSSPNLEPIASAGRIRDLVCALQSLLDPEGGNLSFPGKLWNFLQHIAAGDSLDEASRTVLGQIEEILQELLDQPGSGEMKEEDGWELLRYCLEKGIYYPERAAEQRPVSGWLELPWEPSPHLVVLGLPDTEVPGTAGSDTFLSPGLCQEAGLRTPEMESAFHACRLRMILEGRRNWGRVDILLPDRGLDDYPCQPSRFLFMSEEDQLLDRVHLLMDERLVEEHPLPVDFGCRLMPPEAPELDSISVTDFSSWLANPFGYYLERRMRWRSPEPLPREMDALGFGSLAHAVMEDFNNTEDGRRLLEEKDVSAFLDQSLEKTVSARFGAGRSLPLQIQVNSLLQRLHAAVPDLVKSRREGWLPLKVEWRTHNEIDFRVGGLPLKGIIDLLEYNKSEDLYRVIDYKTSDKGDSPQSTHLMNVTASSRPPLIQESDFLDGNKVKRWKDLQLPLYQMIVQEAFGCDVVCAYFNLAKAVKDTGLREIRFSSEQLNSARACAEAIVRGIQSGEFSYIDPKRRNDPWVPWFGVNNSNVDADWRSRQTGGAQ